MRGYLIRLSREYTDGGMDTRAEEEKCVTLENMGGSCYQESNFKQRLAHMRAWKADGVIAHQSRAHDVKDLRLPTVILCSTHHLPAKTCQLRNDNDAIGRMAADHFLSRIQCISHMLADTDLAMSAIAAAIGYESDTHLSRFFSRCTGTTPSDYRRIHRKG